MKLHQLAEQIDAKAIQLIEIAKALGLLSFHGGTVLTTEQQTQLAAIYRYMRAHKTTAPAVAIAQMTATGADTNVEDLIAISIQPSVADELCRRYPVGTMSDRILKVLGALSALENLLAPYPQQPAAPSPEDSAASTGKRQKISTQH